MFDRDRFIEDCTRAAAEGQKAVREVVAEAVADPGDIIRALGEPDGAGVTQILQSPALTIIKFVWAPYMSLIPHNHHMYAVIGVYAGREDNVFWR